jgi:RHS repeat-associated protein
MPPVIAHTPIETYYKYDSLGNLLTQKQMYNTSWLLTNHTYDAYGNTLTTTNALGRVSYYRYSSAFGSAYLTKQSILVGTQNVTTTYAYNSNTGDMLSETDPNGQTTSYQYDVLDRVTLITYPAIGGVSTYTYYYYYGGNNTMKIIDQNGHVTKDYFDGLSRETEVQRWNGTSAYSAVYYTYNWLNEVATKTTATGSTYTYYYDWDGQQTKLTNPDKSNETTSYDYVNNIKTVTDENGHQTIYSYDWNQRLITVKEYNSSTNYYLTTYTYDLSGNLLSTTDAMNQQTSYQYDDLNRLTTTTFPTSPSTQETRTYDNMGNLQTRTTANGSQISYTYDALNRLTKVTYPGSGGTVSYTYDADGNKLKMVSPSATDYYSYDARDRLTNQTEYVAGVKYQTLYAYDGVGDITSLTYADGYMLTMTYDGVNRLKKVGTFATIGYTVDDMISKITYGNGEVTTYTYDSRDRPTQILDKYGSTKEMDLNYTYDGTGNVLTENSQSYGYDYLSRLTSSTGPWGSITYTYDQTGNRLRTVNSSTTTVYCYGAYNRLSSYSTSSCSSPTVSYTYDANGNLITKSGGWTYSYDYENRLTKVIHSGTTVQTNSYDGNGNRVQQTAGSSTFTYSYQGLNILYEKNVTGSTTTITKHFYAGGLQVAKMVGTAVYYLHQDALGNTRLETTSTVTVKFSSNYVPYGKNYGMSGKEVFMYTGKPYDSATGLYYEGARYYDPTTGRFTIQDSITGTQEDPMSLNRYIYARDNPMKIVDLAGHEWWNPISDITSAASAVTSAVSTVSSDISAVAGDVSGGVSAAANAISTGATDLAGAVSGAWNSLPPADQELAILGIAAVATVVTVGVAAPVIGAAIAGEAAVDASAGVGIDATIAGVATKSLVGGTLNAAATAVGDELTGKPITPGQIITSFGVGAIGGGLSVGFRAAGLAGQLSTLADLSGGGVSTLVDATLNRQSSEQTLRNGAISASQSTVGDYLSSVGAPRALGKFAEFGCDVLGALA